MVITAIFHSSILLTYEINEIVTVLFIAHVSPALIISTVKENNSREQTCVQDSTVLN